MTGLLTSLHLQLGMRSMPQGLWQFRVTAPGVSAGMITSVCKQKESPKQLLRSCPFHRTKDNKWVGYMVNIMTKFSVHEAVGS